MVGRRSNLLRQGGSTLSPRWELGSTLESWSAWWVDTRIFVFKVGRHLSPCLQDVNRLIPSLIMHLDDYFRVGFIYGINLYVCCVFAEMPFTHRKVP